MLRQLRRRRLRHGCVLRLDPLELAVEPVVRQGDVRELRTGTACRSGRRRPRAGCSSGATAARPRSHGARCPRRRPSRRRPFGNPARSPARTPKRFGFAAGGTPRLSLSVSAAAGFLPICVSPGTPVSRACTMSVRFVSWMPRPNSAFRMRAGSGLRANLPKFFASSAGDVALNLSFLPIGMITSLMRGLPRRLTCTYRLRSLPCLRRRSAYGGALALGGRPHADDGVPGLHVRDRLAVPRDLALRHLQHERLRVVARDVVLAAALVAETDVRTARLVDVDPVEHRTEVDEERIVGRSDDRLAAALQRAPRRRPRPGRSSGSSWGRRCRAPPARRSAMRLLPTSRRFLLYVSL